MRIALLVSGLLTLGYRLIDKGANRRPSEDWADGQADIKTDSRVDSQADGPADGLADGPADGLADCPKDLN